MLLLIKRLGDSHEILGQTSPENQGRTAKAQKPLRRQVFSPAWHPEIPDLCEVKLHDFLSGFARSLFPGSANQTFASCALGFD